MIWFVGLCILIVMIPISFLLFRKSRSAYHFLRLQVALGKAKKHKAANENKSKKQSRQKSSRYSSKSKSAAYFIKKFVFHFHPETGKFHDNPELRSLIYHVLIDEIQNGKNYKVLWRFMINKVHPDKAAFGRLTVEECEVAFKYFSNNFEHFDDVKM